MKRKKSIINAALLLLIGTFISKALGFLRELVVAYKYGAGSISDAFLLTNSIPSILFVSIASAISINYIPYYQRINGKDKRDLFTSNLLNVSTIILLIGCILVNIFPETVLKLFAAGLDNNTRHYAVVMLRIVIFSILPFIASHLFQAYLQANDTFRSTALFGVVTNTIIILTTIISNEHTYYLLSLGVFFADLCGLLMVLSNTRKTGFRYSFVLHPTDRDLKALVFLTIPLLAEDLASSFSLLVDRNLASFLPEGTISGLSYAGTLGNIACTIIGTSIITATFPTFSSLIANNEIESFSDCFLKYAKLICYLLAPISAFMVVFSKDIVTLLFTHGAFDDAANIIVSESMECYALGVLPMGIQSYIIRAFYAYQDTKTPVKIKVFALLCNIILNLITVNIWKHRGIALSTSISFLIAFILLLRFLCRKHSLLFEKTIWWVFIKSILLSVASSLFTNMIINLYIHHYSLSKILLEGVLYIMVYLISFIFINRKDTKQIRQLIANQKKTE